MLREPEDRGAARRSRTREFPRRRPTRSGARASRRAPSRRPSRRARRSSRSSRSLACWSPCRCRAAPQMLPGRGPQVSERSTMSALVSRAASAGAMPTTWRGEPAPAQTSSCRSSSRSISTAHGARRRERGDAARLEAGGGEHLLALRDACVARACSGCDLGGVGAAVARARARAPAAPSQTKTSDLTICAGSQPTASAAASAVGVPCGNSSIRRVDAAARGAPRRRARPAPASLHAPA